MLGGEYLTLGTQVELSLIHYAHPATSAQPLVVIALVLSYEYRQRATAVVLFAYCLQPLSDALAFLLTVTLADRKSTRLNSSHVRISYAVFCLKKKNKKQ